MHWISGEWFHCFHYQTSTQYSEGKFAFLLYYKSDTCLPLDIHRTRQWFWQLQCEWKFVLSPRDYPARKVLDGMVDVIKGVRSPFGMATGMIVTTMAMAIAISVMLSVMHDHLFGSNHLESNRMGLHRFLVVEINSSVQNRPSHDCASIVSTVDLHGDCQWSVSHSYSRLFV